MSADEIPPCTADATMCGGTPDACWSPGAFDGACINRGVVVVPLWSNNTDDLDKRGPSRGEPQP